MTTVVHGGSHGRSQFSDQQTRFPEDTNLPSQSPQLHPTNTLTSPNPQLSLEGLMGTFPPQAVTTPGALTTPPLPSAPATLHSNDIGSMLRRSQSICSTIPSYSWSLDNDGFFSLPHDGSNATVTTTSMDLLDLNATISAPTAPLAPPVDGRTVLHVAVEHDRINVIQMLLSRRANIRSQDRWGFTALHIAATRGHEDAARLILSSNAAQQADIVDLADATGYTALHHAAENGHAGMAELLMEAGANPRVQSNTGATPLHLAASGGHEGVVNTLLLITPSHSSPGSGGHLTPGSTGQHTTTSPNSTSGNNTGIQTAVSTNALPKNSAPNTASNSARNSTTSSPPRAQNSNQTTRHDSHHHWSPHLPSLPIHPSVHDLPNIPDNLGATPLHRSADSPSSNSPAIVSLLLSAGAHIDALDSTPGFTPLHYAARRGSEAVVSVLLEMGASVTAKARCGWNALHFAAQGGHDGVAEVLLGRGVDVDGRIEV
jgi:ankyrin repeat protein